MRARCIIVAAAVSLFLSAANASASPPREHISASTYFYNDAANLAVTGLWPGGCYAANPTPCAGLQLDTSRYGSVYYLTSTDWHSFQIHWSDKCWDAFNGGMSNGTPITLNACSNSRTQLWATYLGSTGEWFRNATLINIGSQKCLDADNPAFPARPRAGARLQLWDCARDLYGSANIGNQLWSVDPHIWAETKPWL